MFSDYIQRLRLRLRERRSKKPTPLIKNRHAYDVVRTARSKRMPGLRQLRHIGRILSLSERRLFFTAVGVLLIGLFWFSGLVLAEYRTVVPAVGGTYIEAIVGSPDTPNPLFATANDADKDIVYLIYSGLLRYDKQQQLVPDLATAYSVNEDKKVYTFSLRQDVVWHDGMPLTAQDIAFTFEQIQNPQVNSPLLFGFQGVQVRVIDEYTIEFTLQEPFQPFLDSLTVGILPAHIWEQIPPEQMRLAKPNLHPIGTGPFQFKRLVKDDTGFIFQYELSRFADYYAAPAYIEKLVFQFYGDYESDLGAIQALRQKKVDGLHYVPSYLRDRATRKHVVMHTLQLPQYTALFFNQKRQTALSDKTLRQALAFAIDKDRIIRESLDGDAQVIDGPILPDFPGYTTEIAKIGYDLTQANTLLDTNWKKITAAEYREKRKTELLTALGITATSTTEGNSSSVAESSTTPSVEEQQASIEQQLDRELPNTQLFYRQDKNGQIIRLRLVTADTPEYQQAAQLVAGFWQDLGILTEISYVRPKDLSRDILRERSYDVLLYGVIIGSDPDQYPFWHSSQVAYPGLNLSQYINRSADDLLVKAREATDTAIIADVYRQFQQLILDDIPAIFLYTPIYRYATVEEIRGIDVSRIFQPADRFANITEWYIKTKGDWHLFQSS